VLDSHGGNVELLKALTSDDEQSAFPPGGRTIVFTGHASGQTNLYEVAGDGTGLKQLTTSGGSSPAPCANGESGARELPPVVVES
jgi:Tol biopolymer transport system component